MTTPQQALLKVITDAARNSNCNITSFQHYETIKLVSIDVKHFINGNELTLKCSPSLISEDYLRNIFNELNKIEP